MPNELKPPLGVSPYWYVYQKRITELHEAIGRYVEYISTHKSCCSVQEHKLIAKWARELEVLSLLIAELEESERSDNG